MGQRWNRHTIMAAVRARGSTLAGVGRGVGLSRSSMCGALIKPHPRANRAIAEFLGRSLHELWPRWFDPAGNARNSPLARTRAAKPAPSRPSKSKRREAA